MPPADKRADYGPHAPLPPELNPRRGRPPKVPQQIRVGDLQARNPNAPTRGRHRASPSERETPPPPSLGGTAPPSSLRRATLLSGRVLLALISVGLLIGSGIAWATYRQFTQGIQHGQALPELPKGTKRIDGGKDQNILLLGNDSIAGATAAEVRALGTTMDRSDSATDTMMILHVPADGKKASIISFPRDSWVNIPGHGMFKLNAAYLDGFNDAAAQGAKDLLTRQGAGILLVAQTLSELTGLHIDHYVQVNLLGFYEISEAIGGVNLCLNEAQNKYTEGDPTHPNGYSGINLKKGWNYNVMGTQALAFVRQRYGLPHGDLDRIKRQQYFLSAAFRKVSSAGTLLNPFKLQKLLKAVSTSLQMDNSMDPLKLAEQFQDLSAGNLVFKTIPIEGFTTNDAGSVEIVKPGKVQQFVDQLVDSSSAQHTPHDATHRPLAAASPSSSPSSASSSNGMTAADTAGCIN